MAGCTAIGRDRRLPRTAGLVLALLLGAGGCGDEAEPVDGRGYVYAVPGGYEDVTEESETAPQLDLGAGIRPDTVVIGEREDGFAPSVNVILEPGLPAGLGVREYAEVSLAALRDPAASGLPPEIVETIEGLNPSDVSPIRDTELAGEQAVTWEYASRQRGRNLRVRQVAALMDRTAYSVTLTALAKEFENEAGALDEVVDSWEWNE